MSNPKCGYCGQRFAEGRNHRRACRYHPQFYFPFDIDKEGIHSKGWQCCGSAKPGEPGCTFTAHRQDVRKVHRRNSIAFDYEVIDELADRRRASLEQERALKKAALADDPASAAATERVRALVGLEVSRVVAELGEPYDDVSITNGSSGYLDRSHDLFYRALGLCWVAGTDSVSLPSDSRDPRWGKPLEYNYRITSVRFFADEEEQDEFRANMITDLTGD